MIGLDFETHRIRRDTIAAKPVCLSVCEEGGSPYLLPAWEERTWDLLQGWLEDEEEELLFHGGVYDLTVAAAHRPALLPVIFQALQDARIHDTSIREKLLHLGTHGSLERAPLPDGSTREIKYSLHGLELFYLQKDRGDQKNSEDAWRLNYHLLDGTPIAKWPRDARQYAEEDTGNMMDIFKAQQKRADRLPFDVFKTAGLQMAKAFGLRLQTCYGWKINLEEKRKVEKIVEEALTPEKLKALIEEGIYTPPQPPRPYANGAKHPDGTPKMTKPQKQKISETKLRELVAWICEDADIQPAMTPPSKSFPEGQISLKDEEVVKISHLHSTLREYHKYKELSKLFTTELPRMGDGVRRVHPFYDELKETGRTSSYADKRLGKGAQSEEDYVASANIQNIDPRVRPCYEADPGWVLCSSDYSGLELGTQAQMQLDLFGKSKLADLINAGVDAHAYLGAQLAYLFDEAFKESCDKQKLGSKDDRYQLFATFKKSSNEALRSFYAHYRSLAKPVGLGYPGGLGPATLVGFAAASYGVTLSLDVAKRAKPVWLDAFPECKLNFRYVSEQLANTVPADTYSYTTPMGMRRANASYCAACNGQFLQSPAAEGASFAIFNLARNCYDCTRESVLLGSIPLAWIHDEAIVMLREDELLHEKAFAVSETMVSSMKIIIRDVDVQAEPVLMRRWYKQASQVFDENDRLTVWEMN